MGYEKPVQIDLFRQAEAVAAPSEGGARAVSIRRSAASAKRSQADAARDETGIIEQLEVTGRYRVLRKLEPRPVLSDLWPLKDAPSIDGVRLGVILDTETTGLNHATHEVIELGMIAFTYDQGGVRDVVGVFSALQEPRVAITAEITRITGITNEMVAGQGIDLAAVKRFIEPADLIIAHNARFDRPFCEKLVPGFDVKPWACSVSEVE